MSRPGSSTLRQQLISTFQDPNYRPPPLPSVAVQLLSMSHREEEVDVEEMVGLLERDELLAGLVLRLVGSSIYAGRGSIRSLREGVIRLGVRSVRNIVFEAALRQSVFKSLEYNETVERIGRHSIVTAYLTRVICRHARVSEENIFLCGLLHDIGFAAVLFSLAAKKPSDLPPLPEIWADIDAIHEEASKIITKLWRLPPELSIIVGHHHQVHTGPSSRTAAIVNLANALSERFGANIVGPPDSEGVLLPADTVTRSEFDDSRTLLGLDEAAIERIIKDASKIIQQVSGLTLV